MPLSLWEQIFWQILISIILLIPIWLAGPISPVTLVNLPLILYAAILSSLISPICWIVGIQRIGPARTALFINVVPLAVALLAWSILGEHLHSYHFVGGIIALTGVAVGLREPRAVVGEDAAARELPPREIEEV